MENERAGVTFTWKIENFLHCMQDTGECLWGPPFESKSLRSKFELLLYPKGHKSDDSIEYEIGIFDSQKTVLNYELAFLSSDDSILVVVRCKNEFFSAYRNRHPFVKRDYFESRSYAFLSNETLTVRLKMWRQMYVDSCEDEKISARTVIGVREKLFMWTIQDFSSILENQRISTSVDLEYPFSCLNFELFYDSHGEINIEVIHPQGQPGVALDCMVCLLDKFGEITTKKETKCVFRTGCFAVSQYIQVHRFPTFLRNRSELLKGKDFYIPNDVLSLECKCQFSGAVLLEELQYPNVETIVKTPNTSSVSTTSKNSVPTTLYQVVVTQMRSHCPIYNVT